MQASPSSTPGRWFEALLGRLALSQAARPYLFVVIGVASLLLCLPLAMRLKLLTRFEHLLPEHSASVVELERLQRLTRSNVNGFVILEGADNAKLRRLADALVPALRRVGPPWVIAAESGVHQARSFLLPRATLFPSRAQLEKLLEQVQARWDYEVGKRAGTLIDDTPPAPISIERLRASFFRQQAAADRFKDGYFQSKDGRAVVVIVRAQVAGGDLVAGREALRRIRAALETVQKRPEHAGIKVGYAGELVTQIAEYGAVRDDLIHVGLLGSIMILGVTLLFFMRLRALWTLGLTIAIGVSWTFALTQIAIGHLNMATGFLFSIVVGNGINFGIIYMARYFEERRHEVSPADAASVATRTTWLPTLTAAMAAAAAYGSLGITDFRAFKHFALIGATGMVFCWVATFLVLPSALVIADRWAPFRAHGTGFFQSLRLHGLPYDAPLAWLVRRAPRLIALTGGLLAAAGLVATVPYIRSNPMQYDARRLLNDLGSSRELARLGEVANQILGARIEGSMVVVCDRLDQVGALKKLLEDRKNSAAPGRKPFEAVHTLFDFVPPDQPAKIPIVLELRDLLLRARARGFVADKDWRALEPMLPRPDLTPFGLDDLPEELSYPFTDSRGLRGTIVVIEPAAGEHDWDLHYLSRWADGFRETKLPNGEIIRGSGRAVIYSDMIFTVIHDIPKAVALSIGLTILAVVLTFRRGRHSFGVLVSLFTGVAWVALYLVVSRTKIHFLNFVAIPITFGIGVDYAVNFFQRYASRGKSGVLDVLRTAGGAVVLCSLTTMLGYIALLSSINQAIRGLGALAVAGEITCLLAALLVAPAALLWRHGSHP